MRKITDRALFIHYIEKHGINNIFDQNILKNAHLRKYKRGELILESGLELEYLYLLVDGKVKVYYLFENGRSMFLKFYQGFQLLGDMEFLKDIPVLCNIEAVQSRVFSSSILPMRKSHSFSGPPIAI